MNGMMNWRPTGVATDLANTLASQRGATESRIVVSGATSITQLSGPVASRTILEDGRASLAWDATPGPGQTVDFSATAAGETRYGSVALPSFGEVRFLFDTDLSMFSGSQRIALGVGGVALAAGLAYTLWPKGKRENPRRRR